MTSPLKTTPERIDVDYCRISRDKGGAGVGVETQHGENCEYAESEDRRLADSYVDNDTSAFTGTRRPAYERLCRDIESGRIASVTVWHADRLHRDTDEVKPFVVLARAHGVRLYSTTRGGAYNLETAAGRRALRDDTSAAEYESDHRGERIALARKRQARNGAYSGGVRPYGFGVDTGRTRRVCVTPGAAPEDREYEDRPVLDCTKARPDEAAEVRRWASDLLAGVSIGQIVRSLNERGVPTAAQTDGRAIKYRGKPAKLRGWSSLTVRQILTAPRISGHAVYKGEIVKRDAYDAIIPDETREALTTLFADPARRSTPGNTPRWLGSLIYRCGTCGAGMTVSYTSRSGKRVARYRCPARSGAHSTRSVAALDNYVVEHVIARLARPDVADLIQARPDVDVAALRERVAALEERKTEAASLYAAEAINAAQLSTITATVDGELREVRAQLRTSAAVSPLTDFEDIDTIAQARSVWEELPISRRREVLRLVATVTVHPIARRGRRDFEAETVEIAPNTAA